MKIREDVYVVRDADEDATALQNSALTEALEVLAEAVARVLELQAEKEARQMLEKPKEQEFVKTPEIEEITIDSIPVEAAYLLEAQAKKICQLQKEVDDLFATNARLRLRSDGTGIAYVYTVKSGGWSFQCPPRQ